MPLDATLDTVKSCRGLDGLRWDGGEVVILASGESLSVEQCAVVQRWRDAAPNRFAIAINTTFRRALWADVLYACDLPWWEGRDRPNQPMYVEEAKATFSGQLWTQDKGAAAKYGLHRIASEAGRGISRKPGVVIQGSNGTYQAIGLAYWAGAAMVYLLGLDMHGGHWHGRHPGALEKPQRFDIFLRNFETLAKEVATMPDFRIVNCTPNSSEDKFPKMEWREVFA